MFASSTFQVMSRPCFTVSSITFRKLQKLPEGGLYTLIKMVSSLLSFTPDSSQTFSMESASISVRAIVSVWFGVSIRDPPCLDDLLEKKDFVEKLLIISMSASSGLSQCSQMPIKEKSSSIRSSSSSASLGRMDWIFRTRMFIVDVSSDDFLDSWGEKTSRLRYHMASNQGFLSFRGFRD